MAQLLQVLRKAQTKRSFAVDHAYKIIELTGSSTDTVEDAINQAIARSNETIDKLRWFEVEQIRGHIEDGPVGHFQVTLKVGFSLDES